ncbi:hypothetical protein AAV94_12040 [Lampropedia cohaerens]|uniref:Peptidase M48 domain-containing protein n=1 Tax=Lampropedia cohaerens TaxID=1610491 RepID=A0A0U1PXD7_9BURK|nr:hypothetical protein AAV94_12040 [Lampropedia cohaerens]
MQGGVSKKLLVAVALAVTVAGCQLNDGILNAGGKALAAAFLSDQDVAALSQQACEAADAENRVAASGSRYAQRLARLVQPFPRQINDQPLNYKVYEGEEVNAWAMANGCVRVYTALMDLMNDAELQGVIGHEIGHVALGHSAARLRTAYMTSAAREAVAASGSTTAAVLSQSVAGDLAETLIHAQFSQANELAADDYSVSLLQQLGIDPRALVTGFQKLSALSSGGGAIANLVSSHPPSARRAEHIERRLAGGR